MRVQKNLRDNISVKAFFNGETFLWLDLCLIKRAVYLFSARKTSELFLLSLDFIARYKSASNILIDLITKKRGIVFFSTSDWNPGISDRRAFGKSKFSFPPQTPKWSRFFPFSPSFPNQEMFDFSLRPKSNLIPSSSGSTKAAFFSHSEPEWPSFEVGRKPDVILLGAGTLFQTLLFVDPTPQSANYLVRFNW